MCRTFLCSILKPRQPGHIRVRRALALAVLFGVALLAAAPFWGTAALQAQSQDPADGLRFSPAAVTAAGLTLTAPSPAVGDWLGRSVSNAGDVNDDGYDDIIVGCIFCDGLEGQSTGKAFIYFGGATMNATADIILQAPSPVAEDRFGAAVSTAGDVDGDGIDDVIVGCYQCDIEGDNNEGKAFIFFGGPNMDAKADVTLQALSPEAGSQFGRSVSTAGNINGDGYTDVIIGCAYCAVGKAERAGKAFIFLGGDQMDGVADLTLQAPSPKTVKKAEFAFFGRSVSNAGDVNGDTFDDVIVGCDGCDVKSGFGANEGKAFIFLGGSNMDNEADLALSVPSTHNFGRAVSNAGDINNDGFADVIVGCEGCDTTPPGDEGKAFIFLGGSPMDEVADVTLQAPSPEVGDHFGVSVSTAGDVNGDGFTDVVIGCYQCNTPVEDAGEALIFLGGSNMDDIVDQTLQALAPAKWDRFGYSVSGAGDVNNDGFPDLLVGCSLCDITGDNNEGKAFVYFSEALGDTVTGTVTNSSTTNPILGASVAASTAQSDTTDASGAYALNAVPAGNTTITVSATGYVTQSIETTVTDGETVVQNFALEPDTTAIGTGTVKGKVTDANAGKNLAGVLVKADTGESATTGKSGRYTIENVPEGNRTITASKTGYDTQQKPATVVADQTTTVNFALVPQ